MKSGFWIALLLGIGAAWLLSPANAAQAKTNAQNNSGGNNPPGTAGGTGPDSSQPIPAPEGMPPVYFKNSPSGY